MDNVTEKLSGLTAVVKLQGDTAILSTKFGLPNEKEQLKQKVLLLEQFRDLTVGIDGLIVPRLLDGNEQKGEYTVERARGANLTEIRDQRQGETRDFFAIPIGSKVRGVGAYLTAIGKVNLAGFAFRDHKTDSVFIQSDGTITIVDSDGLERQKEPWKTDQEVRNGIQDVAFAFFTRGFDESTLDSLPEFLSPAGVNTIVSHLDRVDSATTAALRIADWAKGKYDPSRHYPYDPSVVRSDIWKPGMTPYEYDMAEAKYYLDHAMESQRFRDFVQYLSRNRR